MPQHKLVRMPFFTPYQPLRTKLVQKPWDYHGTKNDVFLKRQHRYSPCKPGTLEIETPLRVVSNLSFTATFRKAREFSYLEFAGFFVCTTQLYYSRSTSHSLSTYAAKAIQSIVENVFGFTPDWQESAKISHSRTNSFGPETAFGMTSLDCGKRLFSRCDKWHELTRWDIPCSLKGEEAPRSQALKYCGAIPG